LFIPADFTYAVLLGNGVRHKVFSSIAKEERIEQDFFCEFSIPQRAKQNDLEHIIHLENVFYNSELIALQTSRFEKDLRQYFVEKKTGEKDLFIFRQVALAILELNALGYCHRDIKPKNFVISP